MTNDLLSILCITTNILIAIIPIINKNMYHALATQNNLKILKKGILV